MISTLCILPKFEYKLDHGLSDVVKTEVHVAHQDTKFWHEGSLTLEKGKDIC